MKFSVESSYLLKQLQLANGAIGSNPVLPILEDFLFELKNNVLTISATNLETSITTQVEVIGSGDGLIAVPAKALLDTLKTLPQQPVTFNVSLDNFRIEITSARGKCTLAGENGADFPQISKASDVNSVSLPSNVLMQGITKTIFATSNDELNPAMTGVLFHIDENKITFVATDAHKLVRYAFSEVNSNVTTSFVVPKKALNVLKNSLSAGEEVKLSFNKTNAFFSFGNVKMVCRLIDARYPDYNLVIPDNNPNLVSVTRADLQRTLKLMTIYANKSTNQVILNIGDGSLTISAQDLDFSNEATEQLVCQFNGEPMTIGFNAKFLIEMLNVLESEEVNIELSTPNRAGILRPVEQAEGEDILMLVMPVMLNN